MHLIFTSFSKDTVDSKSAQSPSSVTGEVYMYVSFIQNVIVYREGDIVKQPMKKGSFVAKNVPGVGWGGVGWVVHEGVGWGGS